MIGAATRKAPPRMTDVVREVEALRREVAQLERLVDVAERRAPAERKVA